MPGRYLDNFSIRDGKLYHGDDELQGITDVYITLGQNTVPLVELSIQVPFGFKVEGLVETVIDEPTKRLLVKLGWTPPSD